MSQDFSQTILRSTNAPLNYKEKEGKATNETIKKFNAGTNKSANTGFNASKIEENAEEGDLHHKTVSYDLKLQIQRARQDKGMTQKELATKCNLAHNIIIDYESGKIIPNHNHLQMMSKVLGVTLKNK